MKVRIRKSSFITLKKKYLFFSFFIILSFIGYTQSTNLLFNHLNKEKGFSQSVCNGVFKDSRGFLWITTHSGLYRYDGVKFVDVTKNNTSLKSHSLIKVLEDKDGNLWLSKYDTELIKYDQTQNTFETIDLGIAIAKKGIKLQSISILHIDEYNRLWIGSNTGLLGIYHLKEKKLQFLYIPQNEDLSIVAYFHPNEIYQSSFYYYDYKAGNIYRSAIDPSLKLQWKLKKVNPKFIPFDYAMGLKDEIWSVNKGLLCCYNWISNTTTKYYYKGKKINIGKSPRMLTDGNEQLWISAEDGLYCFSLKEKRYINKLINSPEDQNSISPGAEPIMWDLDNNLWLLSFGNGIDYCNLNNFRFDHLLNKVAASHYKINNFIRAIESDEFGNIYASIEKTGVVKLDNKGKFIKTIVKESGFSFECMMKDKRGNIWIGGERLIQYLPKSDKTIISNQFFIDRIISMLERPDGKLLIGTYGNLLLFDTEKRLVKRLKPLSAVDLNTLLFCLPDQILLNCQRDKGINLLKEEGDKYSFVKKLDSSLFVKCILSVAPDTLWLATTRGLYSYVISKQILEPLEELNRQLPDLYVYSLLKDKNGFFWTSTNSGLCRFNKDVSQFKNFGSEFGIQDMEFNSNAFCTMKSGDLLFGGVNGINKLSGNVPDKFIISKPRLQIISIKADELITTKPISINKYADLKINPGTSFVEIEFNAIEFFNPEKVKVKYRLKNYNDEWIFAGNSGIARFVNVTPGNYQFEIIAMDADGQEAGEAQLINIYFMPYWWQTLWFKIFLILLIIVSVYYTGKVITRYKLQEQRKQIEKQFAVQKERERIITDLHDDIGATLSSMSIYGELAGHVLNSKPDESKKMIEKIALTSKDLMGRMNDIIWSMKSSSEDNFTLESRLRNYSYELLSPKNISCDFIIDEILAASVKDPEKKRNLLLIVKEAINNIAKYSLATKAIVQLYKLEKEVILSIKDNGKGYEKNKISNGNGLNNIQERCKQLNGLCTIEAQPGEGVFIICRLPHSELTNSNS